MIFQGSKPIAASTTPTRIDNRISRNATASGVPPRKRYRPSLLAGKSLTSFGIEISFAFAPIIDTAGQIGNPLLRGYGVSDNSGLNFASQSLTSAPAAPA